MTNLTEGFKQLVFKKELPDESLLVPLFTWLSGSYPNIENTQLINKYFFYVPKDLLMRSLLYHNKQKSFLKYPKGKKREKSIEFFMEDVCKYYGWTRNELDKNFDILDWNYLTENIPRLFGYEKGEIKKVKKWRG